MVKNDKGGKGAKSLARKAVSNAGSNRLQLSTCNEEQYACVTNMYGNGMCEIYTNDDVKLICHIRNKFRGRQKRSNTVTRYSIVLVGLRDYEITPKNCDLLCIYDDQEIEQLKNIPNINISHILQLRMNHLFNANGNGGDTSDVIFTNDIEEELDVKNNTTEYEFKLETNEEINIEDI